MLFVVDGGPSTTWAGAERNDTLGCFRNDNAADVLDTIVISYSDCSVWRQTGLRPNFSLEITVPPYQLNLDRKII